MTNPNSPNSPKQKYYTTEIGKKVFKVGEGIKHPYLANKNSFIKFVVYNKIMNVEATKLDIVQTIVNSTDPVLLTELQQFLKSRETDWFDQLLPSQQQDVMDGIAEADRGETIPHKEIVKRFSKWGMK